MAQPFRFDRRWAFDVEPAVLWDALSDTSRFPEWFPWLEGDLGPLVAGTTARFRVDPPLPYRLHLQVEVAEVVPGERVVGVVSGDLAGPARLEVEGSTARLVWSLEVRRPSLRALERLGRPAMVWGHDRVVASGLRRFGAVLGAAPMPR